jgi:pilus assembly protein CpaB
VEILAVSQPETAPAANRVAPVESQLVTLLVMPDQASKLNLAQSKGTLHLALRNQNDANPVARRVVGMQDLGLPEPRREPPPAAPPTVVEKRPPPPPPPPPGQIRILRGLTEGMHTFLPAEEPNGRR